VIHEMTVQHAFDDVASTIYQSLPVPPVVPALP